MATGLKDKVVIVTGAARGQGAAAARLFCAEGARVILSDIDESGRAFAVTLGDNALFIRHDISSQADWASVVAEAAERFGGVDVLVNNGALYRPGTLLETDEELWDRHYRVNQLGVFYGMKAVAQLMAGTGQGVIINIASMGALGGFPGTFAYSATKWAVRGMTAAAAVELGPLGIRVNGIYPGAIDTPMVDVNPPEALEHMRTMVPMRRFGQPDEVAHAVVFLASDAASYINGAELKITGGL
jgi:3alpha(or 20beta)-hydroxysteroid dehydrogenase